MRRAKTTLRHNEKASNRVIETFINHAGNSQCEPSMIPAMLKPLNPQSLPCYKIFFHDDLCKLTIVWSDINFQWFITAQQINVTQ